MSDEMTDTSVAPAQTSAPVTQQSAAPAGAAADTADGAGTQGAADQGQGNAAGQTPLGALASAAEGTNQQQQAQLLAGKFKTPQDLEKGYLEAQKYSSRLAQERKALEEQLRSVQAASSGRQEQQQQQVDPFMERWQADQTFGPLAKAPDPRYDPQGHQEWVEKVFTPRFVNDPTGTMRYLVAPEIRAAVMQVRESLLQEFQSRDQTSQLTGFFGSKPEFLGGKSVNEALNDWGEDAIPEYEQLLQGGMPVEGAIELMALRRGQKPLQAAAAAAQARDNDLKRLASGAPNRGAAQSAAGGFVGEGETFEEKVANALAQAGTPLARAPVMRKTVGGNPFSKK